MVRTRSGRVATNEIEVEQIGLPPKEKERLLSMKSIKDHENDSPLHLAAAEGNRKLCNTLLQGCRGCRPDTYVNDTEKFPLPPLYISAMTGHAALCYDLLKWGAKVNYANTATHQQTAALHAAAIGGHAEVCQLLLNHGADVNIADKSGITPLHYAACGGALDVCEVLLLQGGADVNAKDEDGWTPRDYLTAAQVEVTELFIQNGGVRAILWW